MVPQQYPFRLKLARAASLARRRAVHLAVVSAISFAVVAHAAAPKAAPADKSAPAKASAAKPASTNPPAAYVPPPPPPQSVFVDDLKLVKDPFFPKSDRRAEKVAGNQPAWSKLPENMVLKGISGPRSRRLAIINNYTLAVGEEATFRVDGTNFRIKCLEIRDDSVLIQMPGSTGARELKLRAGM